MPAGGRATVRSRRLGAALRRHRLAAQLDQATAAETIVSSIAKISRMESGHVSSRVLDVRALLDLYQVTDQEERARLERLARESNRRDWWLDYKQSVRAGYADHITLETDATHIRAWQPVLIPGLLQTASYIEAVIRTGPEYHPPERIAELVKVRLERQRRIREGEAHMTAIVWEPALANPMGGPEVHRAQLAGLLEIADNMNVTFQVLPASAGLIAGMSGPFTAFTFDSEAHVEAVTVENPRNTTVVEDSADLALYANTFDQFRSAALSPQETSDWIQRILNGQQ